MHDLTRNNTYLCIVLTLYRLLLKKLGLNSFEERTDGFSEKILIIEIKQYYN